MGGAIYHRVHSEPIKVDLVKITNGNELRFYDVGDSNYVGFEAPALTANCIWVLPQADGSALQVLRTDGSKNLSWASAAAGAGTFELDDTNASHILTGSWDEDDSANRTLKFKVNTGNRVIDLSGDLTLSIKLQGPVRTNRLPHRGRHRSSLTICLVILEHCTVNWYLKNNQKGSYRP